MGEWTVTGASEESATSSCFDSSVLAIQEIKRMRLGPASRVWFHRDDVYKGSQSSSHTEYLSLVWSAMFILVGSYFLSPSGVVWPVVLILLGLFFLFRR